MSERAKNGGATVGGAPAAWSLIVDLRGDDPEDLCGVTHTSASYRAACKRCAEILANLEAARASRSGETQGSISPALFDRVARFGGGAGVYRAIRTGSGS